MKTRSFVVSVRKRTCAIQRRSQHDCYSQPALRSECFRCSLSGPLLMYLWCNDALQKPNSLEQRGAIFRPQTPPLIYDLTDNREADGSKSLHLCTGIRKAAVLHLTLSTRRLTGDLQFPQPQPSLNAMETLKINMQSLIIQGPAGLILWV